MENARKEFLSVLCNLYMTALLAVLPLYTAGTYYQLGDAKYAFFRNASLLCICLWLVLGGVPALLKREHFSTVDLCMLAYGICVLISAMASSFGETAWTGYREWYMGALSQLLLIGIYFMVSREYDGNGLPVYLGEAAFLAVTVIGLLNRLGVDPLGLYEDFQTGDWEYSHLLSTLGNINWLCGYYSVMLAFPMADFLYWDRRHGPQDKTGFLKKGILCTTAILGLTLLCIQGSDSGPVIAASGIGLSLLVCRNEPECFQKGLFLGAGVSVSVPVMGWAIRKLQTQAATPVDGDAFARMQWQGWWILAAFLGGCAILHSRMKGRARKIFTGSLLAIGAVSAGAVLALTVYEWRGIPIKSWGSGRGALWEIAWEGFCRADFGQKLLGAGPDCFARYLIAAGIPPVIDADGHWAGMVYANAHSEWLTQLVNLGLLGTAAYLAVFVSAFQRCKRGLCEASSGLLGILALGMYGVHSLVSFQQVLNAPFLFLVLGLCEADNRKAEDAGRETTDRQWVMGI